MKNGNLADDGDDEAGKPPVKHEKKVLEMIRRKLKKTVALDIVNFGEKDEGKTEKLEALLAAVNNNDTSHIVHVPAGTNALSDVLIKNGILFLELLEIAEQAKRRAEVARHEPPVMACEVSILQKELDVLTALDTFNIAVVSPIYYVMFTTLTILASVIMFKLHYNYKTYSFGVCRLRNEVNKLEERLGVAEDHLKQKNLKIKKLTDEKKCALATQYVAEATLRRVHANQKDNDILPIDSIITPFEAEIKIYKNELQIM
ncbi:hypothetical protein HN51_000517 [Arachis hypogaea]